MKKSDLKTGMLVMRREGAIQLLVKKTFIVKTGGFNLLSSIDDDLSNVFGDGGDIIKVSKVLNGYSLGHDQWTESMIDNNLLWKEIEAEIFACELDGVKYSESTLRSIIKKANS